MSLRCYLFGHKMKWRDEGSANIGAPCKCVRCGHEVPAVAWSTTTLESAAQCAIKPLMAESHRVPPIPACKPPRTDPNEVAMQQLEATNALLHEVKELRHQMERASIIAAEQVVCVTRKGYQQSLA